MQGQERDHAWISFGYGYSPDKLRIIRPKRGSAIADPFGLLNVTLSRSRLSTRLYHSVLPSTPDVARFTDEFLALESLFAVERLVERTAFEFNAFPHNATWRYARSLAPAHGLDPDRINVVNLGCVVAVAATDYPPNTLLEKWRYGVFRARSEWSPEDRKAARDLLSAKGWTLHDL